VKILRGLKMTEQFEYKGTWFLPSNKELRFSGVLTYDRKKGGKLELFGNFENKRFLHDFKNEEIIQGVTSDSEHITLVDCLMISPGEGRFRVGKEYGTPSVKYKIELILEGVHIDKKDDLKFQQLSARIQNLDEWIGIYGFSRPEYGRQNKEIHISCKLPSNIEFQINNDWNGQFFFSFDAPLQPQKVTVTQNIYFHMSSQSEHSLTDVLRYFYWFQHFLVLGLHRKTYWQEITLCSERFTTQLTNTIKLTSIKLYPYNIDYETVESQRADMLFSYQDIKTEFPSLIKNWFEKYELLEHQFNLLFANFYMDKIFSENTFLNLARAAESFHAKTHEGETKMDADKYEEMKKCILEFVDKKMEERFLKSVEHQDAHVVRYLNQEYHSWLKEKFNFGNQLTLHDRLSSLVDTCSNEVLNSVLGDKETFLRQVKQSRNFYTHYSEPKKHTLKDGDLYILSEKLKLLLVCAFLLEIGMEHQKLSSLLENIDTRHLVS
jgi:hypothetical protein